MDLSLLRHWRLFTSRELSRPAYLVFFVTSRCMGKCRHCFYWQELNREENPLTVQETEKVARSLGRILQVTFTGGEPFLREDFPELALAFYRGAKPYHLGIATSGFHPGRVEEGVRFLLERCEQSWITVGLPVEGPPKLNDQIRGVRGFYERTAESIARLAALKRKHPRLTILVDITASGFNRGWLMETYEQVRNTFQPDNINLILTRGIPREEGAKNLDPEEVEKLLRRMEEDARRGRVQGYSFFSRLLHAKDVVLRDMALDIYRTGAFHLPCQAGRIAGVLMPEGDVYPCELWEEPVGNVREAGYDFSAVWQSEKAKAAREEILSSQCTCYHQCFLSNTIFFNLRAWPKILRKWAGLVFPPARGSG